MGAAFRHFLDLSAVSAGDIRTILDDARARKHRLKAGAATGDPYTPPVPEERTTFQSLYS